MWYISPKQYQRWWGDSRRQQNSQFKIQQKHYKIKQGGNSNMLGTKSNNNNMMTRGHSFINRTPHTVLTIANKCGYAQIAAALAAGIPVKQNSKPGCTPAPCNVRCLKIQDCNFGNNSQEQQSQFAIPLWISTGILHNITKLIITKCKVKTIQFMVTQDNTTSCSQQLFPNLQQFEGTINNLIQIPSFLYNCTRLVKVNLCNNHITLIDNRLTQLNQLKYVGLLANRINWVGIGFCVWAVDKDIGIDLQWHISLLSACLHITQDSQSSAPVSLESTMRIGTTITESDFNLNCDEVMSPQSPKPNLNILNLSGYITISQQVPLLFNKNVSNKMVTSQIQTFLHCQHLSYLKILEQFITDQMCDKYIESCFTQRKYSSLDSLLLVKSKLRVKAAEKEVLKQKNQIQLNEKKSDLPKSTKSTKQNKQNKQSKQNKLAVRKQIKMLQPTQNNKPKEKTNQAEQLMIGLNQYSKLLIPVIMSFNLQNYKQIPICYYYQITRDDFIWILNELEVVEKCRTNQQIQEVFSSPYFQKMFNHSIKDEEDLEDLASNVHNKNALKKLFLFTEFKYFENFDFMNIPVLKLILRLDDFIVFRKFETKYKNFTEALFSNSPRSISITTLDKRTEVSSINTSKSIICESRQGTSWKYLVSPHSKLYKYIFKQYKKYINKQLGQDQNKNLHFPEYIPSQSLVIHNDVHDYDMLKDYEEFQASFCHKDLKLLVRHSNIGNHFSISKRIYMQVVNQASSKIRHIGKSREKLKSDSKILNKTFVCNVRSVEYSDFDSGLPSPSMLSCARSEKQKQGIEKTVRGKKFNKTSQISCRKINSIQVSCRKQKQNIPLPKKKKNGIIIYSNSESQLKGFCMNKLEENGPKKLYLDLSKNRNPLSNKNSNTNGQDNFNSNQNNGGLKNNCNQIQCSTFDIT